MSPLGRRAPPGEEPQRSTAVPPTKLCTLVSLPRRGRDTVLRKAGSEPQRALARLDSQLSQCSLGIRTISARLEAREDLRGIWKRESSVT